MVVYCNSLSTSLGHILYILRDIRVYYLKFSMLLHLVFWSDCNFRTTIQQRKCHKFCIPWWLNNFLKHKVQSCKNSIAIILCLNSLFLCFEIKLLASTSFREIGSCLHIKHHIILCKLKLVWPEGTNRCRISEKRYHQDFTCIMKYLIFILTFDLILY